MDDDLQTFLGLVIQACSLNQTSPKYKAHLEVIIKYAEATGRQNMKTSFGYQQILIGLLVLAFAQLACNFGAQPSNTGRQKAPTSAVLTTEPPASATDTTQPPASSVAATQTPSSSTAQRGTPDEARTMLQKAVEHYKTVGRAQALSDFTGRVAPFFDRDLYVACIDSQLAQSANGGFPNLVGSTVQPISRKAWDAASNSTIGSVNYVWIDPANGNSERKTFYYEKVGSDVCGVGAYHP